MAKAPELSGLVLCNALEVDSVRREVSLRGIFNHLDFSVFPTPARDVTAYCVFFDGRGEGQVRWTCTHLETESDVKSVSRWLAFQRPGLILHSELRFRQLSFPAPGRYEFSVRFDSHILTTRYLDVRRT